MTYTTRPYPPSEGDPAPGPTVRQRVTGAVFRILVAVGLRRGRREDGTLDPRKWSRLLSITGALVALWLLSSAVHIVPAGTVGVPVTLGSAGSPLGEGFHLTPPFTTVKVLSVRTTAYTMAAATGEGSRGAVDDSVQVLGADGASGAVDSTVLFRIDPTMATSIYTDIGLGYTTTLIRPSARTCIRSVFTDVSMVEAATTAWHDLEDDVTTCMSGKLEGRGIVLEDFQLREVHLEPVLQSAVTAKTAAEQNAERQQFELSVARQQAEITRVDAIATADAQQILACGGDVQDVVQPDGTVVEIVVPKPIDRCTQAQLTPQYLQWTYIQALRALVDSPNNSTIILPFDQNLTPLINVPSSIITGPETVVPQAPETETDTTTTTQPEGG